MASPAWIAALGVLLAQPASRAEVLERARTLWDDDDMRGVATLFEESYAADPQPEYLFGLARAEARLDNCERTFELLEAFLETNPPQAQIEGIERVRAECESEIPPPTEAPAPKPIVPAPSTEPSPVSSPPPDPIVERTAPSRRDQADPPDALGWTLVATGTAALAAGTGMFFAGRSRVANPDPTMNEQDYRSSTTRSQRLGWAGLGVGGAGVGLLAGGIVRLVLHRRK